MSPREGAKAERGGQWRQPAAAGSLVTSEKHGQIEEHEESKPVFTPASEVYLQMQVSFMG